METLKDQIVRRILFSRWGGAAHESVQAALETPLYDQACDDSASPEPEKTINASSGVDFYAAKIHLHQKLLTRIDLNSIESLTPEQLRSKLGELLVTLIEEDAHDLNDQEHTRLVSELKDEIIGVGPIEPLLADPTISQIMVNGCHNVYIEKNGCIQLTDICFNDDEQLLKIIDKIFTRVGLSIDESCPLADAHLPDGSLVNAIIPPLALDGPVLTIRRRAVVLLQMNDIIYNNTLTPSMAELLAALVKVKCNILISGGTGTGKTTLLNILSGFIPASERIVTLEDRAELRLQQNHVMRFETRKTNIKGKVEITMRALLKNALRRKPDRIVLGEVRGDEVIDMLQAMNTGHEGSLTTIHANSSKEALWRLENLVGMAGVTLPSKAMRQLISSSLDFIVQIARLDDGRRKVTSIQEISCMEGDTIITQEIFCFKRTCTNPDGTVQGVFTATGIRPKVAEKIRNYGIVLSDGMFNPGSKD